jgi:hypothetical protein
MIILGAVNAYIMNVSQLARDSIKIFLKNTCTYMDFSTFFCPGVAVLE